MVNKNVHVLRRVAMSIVKCHEWDASFGPLSRPVRPAYESNVGPFARLKMYVAIFHSFDDRHVQCAKITPPAQLSQGNAHSDSLGVFQASRGFDSLLSLLTASRMRRRTRRIRRTRRAYSRPRSTPLSVSRAKKSKEGHPSPHLIQISQVSQVSGVQV